MLGKKSGIDSIRIKAEELGLDVAEERQRELLAAVKRLGAEKRGLVTDDEFRALARVRSFDAVIVGSGINSLACGALLARAGWGVCILEREAVLGGAIRTEELTEPGFLHDTFSAWHPLWVGGAAHARSATSSRRAASST